jgi:hypothetical protein
MTKTTNKLNNLHNMKEIKITWSTEDVLMRADELSIELTEFEADNILDELYENHDASIGICWDVIGSYIYQYDSEREAEIKETI